MVRDIAVRLPDNESDKNTFVNMLLINVFGEFDARECKNSWAGLWSL